MSRAYFGKDLEAMSFAPNYHRWIFRELAPYLGARVAEVGAGTGNFSELLLQNPKISELVALEPSTNMFPALQARLAGATNAQAQCAFFGDCGYREVFDTVCYINVLEHIENDQRELEYVWDSLKPGGHVCLFVPALSSLYSELDRKVGHFRRYHKQPLADLISRAGFRLVEIKYFDIAGILPWYVAFVLLGQTTTPANVSLYDRVVVPVMSRVEGLIRPPLGKNLLAVGRKPTA